MTLHETLAPDLVETAAGVYHAAGTHTNWVLVTDGDAVTVVDAGMPKDLPRLEASLAAIGRRPSDVGAVVLTHAHVDHMGDAARWRRRYGTRVLVWEPEVPLARGDVRQMISPLQVAGQLLRPGWAAWAVAMVRAESLAQIRAQGEHVPDPEPFSGHEPLDVPGALVPVPTPGHTSGHCAYHLPDRGVLISGDSLVTEAYPRTGTVPVPQVMVEPFQHDFERAVGSLAALAELEADVVLPGHGPAYYGTPWRAVEEALRRLGRPMAVG